MNCHSFAEICTNIARGELIDAAVRDDAQKHSDSCVECRSQMADQMRLSEGLKALAGEDRVRPVPVVDELVLRQMFQANRPGLSHQGLSSAYYLRLASGIAAGLLVAFGSLMFFRQSGTDNTPDSRIASSTPSVQPVIPTKSSKPEVTPEKEIKLPAMTASRARSVVKAQPGLDSSYVDVTVGEFRPASTEPEETTEFIPTVQGGDVGPLTSGQVVRVTVPRSAMNYFGLPVGADRANERVAADVLLGEDGLARAIRFVR